MVMLHASLAIAVAFLAVEDTKPAAAEMNVYKSSQLGFSIQYPATWQKCRDKKSWCGTGRKGLTQNQRLRKPISPVIFSPSCKRHRMEGLRVTVFRKYEQVLGNYVASITPNVQGFQKVIADFEFGAGRMGKKVSLGPESWTYVLLADGRLFVLSGLCWNDWEAALLEHTFDAMAKSLTLGGQGTPGTFRRYEDSGVSFEYPADSTLGGHYDDEENIGAGVNKPLTIYAPEDPDRSLGNERTRIECGQYPPEPDRKATINDYIIETKRVMALIQGETSFRHEAFQTQRGQKGIRYSYIVKIPPNFEMNSVGFVIPNGLGRLQFLGFWYATDQHDKLEPIIEHVGRSLVVK